MLKGQEEQACSVYGSDLRDDGELARKDRID